MVFEIHAETIRGTNTIGGTSVIRRGIANRTETVRWEFFFFIISNIRLLANGVKLLKTVISFSHHSQRSTIKNKKGNLIQIIDREYFNNIKDRAPLLNNFMHNVPFELTELRNFFLLRKSLLHDLNDNFTLSSHNLTV